MDETTQAVAPPMEVEPTEAIITEHSTMGLTAFDRCDASTRVAEHERKSCGAQAYAKVKQGYMSGDEQIITELLFCGHHLEEYLPRLRKTALAIDDYRPSLIKPRSTDIY